MINLKEICAIWSPGLKFELVFEIHEDKNNDELLRMLCKCLSGLEKGYVIWRKQKQWVGNF